MSETIEPILKKELQTLQDDIIKRHEKARQVASGGTKDSFDNYTTTPYSGVLVGAEYVGALEAGRRDGKVPYDFKNIIQRWAQAKGISFSTQQEFERWANAVAWKIRREGTELYRSGQTEDVFETPIKEFNERLTQKIPSFYRSQIQNLINNFE